MRFLTDERFTWDKTAHIASEDAQPLGFIRLCTVGTGLEALHSVSLFHGDIDHDKLCVNCCRRLGLTPDQVMAKAVLEEL